MAISKNIELENGIKVEGAYLRVEFTSLSKRSQTFTVRKYADIQKPFFSEETHTSHYDIEGSNPFAQAYEYLKTLPEYVDAIDV